MNGISEEWTNEEHVLYNTREIELVKAYAIKMDCTFEQLYKAYKNSISFNREIKFSTDLRKSLFEQLLFDIGLLYEEIDNLAFKRVQRELSKYRQVR